MRTYYDSGINWNWYLEVTVHEDNTVTIHNHYRLHKYNDRNHPETSGSFRLTEDDNRIVLHVRLDDKQYPVRNQQHVFSYGKK